jgi:hypothetical protein
VILRDLEMAAQTPSHGSSQGAGAGAALPRRSTAILRYLDVLLVVLAVPVALALGAPAVGVLVSAGAWLMQRALARVGQRWIAGRGDDARFGLNLVDGFGRIWLLAGAIVLAAVIGGRRDGLAAALLIFCAYSIAFAMRLVSGRPLGEPQR